LSRDEVSVEELENPLMFGVPATDHDAKVIQRKLNAQTMQFARHALSLRAQLAEAQAKVDQAAKFYDNEEIGQSAVKRAEILAEKLKESEALNERLREALRIISGKALEACCHADVGIDYNYVLHVLSDTASKARFLPSGSAALTEEKARAWEIGWKDSHIHKVTIYANPYKPRKEE
jgi:hypothetical protein